MQPRLEPTIARALLVLSVAACAGTTSTSGPGAVQTGSAATPVPATAAPATPRPEPTLAPGVTAVVKVPFRASGIVASSGHIWAEDHAQTSAVYAIDPETGATAGTVDLQRPCDVVAAGDLMWAADLDAGKVVAIDPATFEVVSEVAGLPGPCGLQYTDGSLWMVVDVGLAKVDPEKRTAEVFDLGGGTFPGSGTPLWVTAFGTGELSRIDVETGKRLAKVAAPGGPAEMISLAVAFDRLWAGNAATQRVYRLDPETGEIQDEIATAPPARFLPTESGLWLTSYDTGLVERIDPETNEVVYRVRVGGTPNGITEGFGSIWVADTGNGRLFRIDPAAVGLFE